MLPTLGRPNIYMLVAAALGLPRTTQPAAPRAAKLPPPRARVSRPQEHEGVQTVQTESLLAYEASSDDAVLDTSVHAWSSLLSSLTSVDPLCGDINDGDDTAPNCVRVRANVVRRRRRLSSSSFLDTMRRLPRMTILLASKSPILARHGRWDGRTVLGRGPFISKVKICT